MDIARREQEMKQLQGIASLPAYSSPHSYRGPRWVPVCCVLCKA